MAIVNFKTVQSFAQFLWNWKLGGSKTVDQNTANLRAAICAACHNNKATSEVTGGCSACNKAGGGALNLIRTQLMGQRSTPRDKEIKTCGICGCDLKISVWIPNQILLSKEDANAYPSFCFKKKILEGTEV